MFSTNISFKFCHFFFSSFTMMDVSAATAAPAAPWPSPTGPNSLPPLVPTHEAPIHSRAPPVSGPLHHPPHPRLVPPPHRLPIRPFFVREIYKNGFLKRLAHNEKKSSALSKLMRSDRYWVVFSVHDLGPEQVNLLSLNVCAYVMGAYLYQRS